MECIRRLTLEGGGLKRVHLRSLKDAGTHLRCDGCIRASNFDAELPKWAAFDVVYVVAGLEQWVI